MGIFEKLKNALFEEEYVEVVEKPKTQKVSKKKTAPREKIKEKYSNKDNDFEYAKSCKQIFTKYLTEYYETKINENQSLQNEGIEPGE